MMTGQPKPPGCAGTLPSRPSLAWSHPEAPRPVCSAASAPDTPARWQPQSTRLPSAEIDRNHLANQLVVVRNQHRQRAGCFSHFQAPMRGPAVADSAGFGTPLPRGSAAMLSRSCTVGHRQTDGETCCRTPAGFQPRSFRRAPRQPVWSAPNPNPCPGCLHLSRSIPNKFLEQVPYIIFGHADPLIGHLQDHGVLLLSGDHIRSFRPLG